MNIVVLQENLSNALTLASKFLPSKTSTVSVVNNFFLQATKQEIILRATDLEATITVQIPGKTEEEGTVLLPAKTIQSLISLFSGEKLTVRTDKKGVLVKGENSEAILNTSPEEAFPHEEIQGKSIFLKLSGKELIDIIQKTEFSVSSDLTRAVLTGVLFSSSSKGLTVVTTDGFRLSVYQKEQVVTEWKEDIIVPVKAVRAFGSLLEEDKESLELRFYPEEKKLSASKKTESIVTRLIEGSFPDYHKIIPQSAQTTVEIDRAELLKAVKLASVFARESANIIKLSIKGNDLTVSANAPQTGENKTALSVKKMGEDLDTAFNYRFLIDVLNASEEEIIVLESNGPLQPGVFHFGKKVEYFHIIMPVRLQDSK
ncbi:MAG: DNA polymerase III subunit beta [Candidatus Roizmanbacteria bacterium]|nr:DNA polymerase III subunit beta [Candidatus Roizmanbacteria bacterium]